MKTNNENMNVSLLAVAVQGALLAMFAMPVYAADAADDEVAALKRPVNSIEVGVSNVSQSSAKFGEYNGLNKAAANVIGNFSVKGGDAYNPFGESGTLRWGMYGSDLGTTSRALGGSVGSQGKWDLSIGYDELQHNIADTYQTPYVGAMGGNTFLLPVGLPRLNNTNLITPAQLQTVAISSTRKNTNVGAGIILNDAWSVKFDYNQLVQSGAKLMSFGSMKVAGGSAGEYVSILANPTNYKTDSINLALNWLGDNAYATGSYYGSFFRDANTGVKFQTFDAIANGIQTQSTMPSNDFHQLNLSGGYTLTPTTKLTGGLSYAKNTQNSAYAYDVYSMVNPVAPFTNGVSPQASLNGDVRTTHADVKLVDQTTKALTLSASVKFDERNNKTASNFYYMNALDGATNHQGNFANAPVSNSKTQFELAGDYRIDKDQLLNLTYNREDVKRWCNQYAIGGLGVVAGGAPGSNLYPAGANCVVAVASKDDKLSTAYKLKLSDAVKLNVGYAYSQRSTTSDANAITPRLSLNGNLTGAVPLIQGVNAGDFRGFYPFFNASRKQQMLKGGVNWQANEKFSLGMGAKFTDDKYDSLYGVKAGNSWSVNLDADYNYSENGSFSAYLTQEHKQRDMTDLQTVAAITANATRLPVPANGTWSDRQKDDDTTIGLALKQNGLMDSKLDLTGDLSYSMGRTGYTTVLNYVGTTATPNFWTCNSPTLASCGSLPTIKNDVIQLKLTGKYKVSKSAEVTVGYLFQQMRSTDYYYNGLQSTFTPNQVMPTNQQSPNYTINVVTASYSYLF